METTQIATKKTMKAKFVILQVVTLLLVAAVLVSFSDISILPTSSKEKLSTKKEMKEEQPAANNEAIAALENNLLTYQKLVKEKQNRINELEGDIKTLQASDPGTSRSNETDLKAEIQKLELQLSEKEATITELVGRIQTLEKAKPAATTPSDKGLVDKLRADIEKLETRNALLVKLNNDLKKNNEFLSSQQKP